VDAREVTDSQVGPEILELTLQLAREQRDEITLWLAVQTLMTDNVATADAVLTDRLCILQDRVENMLRARYDLPNRDSGREATGE
jgi:hypothetical protein